MATISLCMIVKNEEKVLARCLDSIADLMDEIIIVDTGSTDSTKEIAGRYTDLVYDFKWVDDFSAARNFAFEKATMDYIYSADADEILDEENHRQFALLKEAIVPEVEIVQMHYREEGIQTVLNENDEYRPKLFKRLRTFTWIDPVHETVRLDPVVFDSDIYITHKPEGNHSGRDFSIFEKSYEKQGNLSCRILTMYEKELYKWGNIEDLEHSVAIILDMIDRDCYPEEALQEAYVILARTARLKNEDEIFLEYANELIEKAPCSEIMVELSLFYEEKGEDDEAVEWLRKAREETEPILDIGCI